LLLLLVLLLQLLRELLLFLLDLGLLHLIEILSREFGSIRVHRTRSWTGTGGRHLAGQRFAGRASGSTPKAAP